MSGDGGGAGVPTVSQRRSGVGRAALRREFDLAPAAMFEAVAHARALRPLRWVETDPGRALCAPDAAVLLTPGHNVIQIERAKLPIASSIGDTGRTAVVTLNEVPRGVSLNIGVGDDALRGLDPATCRLFWWDERRRNLVLVEPSGLGVDGTYVHGVITQPGMYTVYGLPADRARRDSLLAWQYLSPWEGVERDIPVGLNGDNPLHQRFCHMIVCSDLAAQAGPDVLDRYGLAPIVTGQFGQPEFVGGKAGPFELGEVRDPADEVGPLGPPMRPLPPGPSPTPPKSICDECLGAPSAVPPDFGFRPRPRPGDQIAGRVVNGCEHWSFVGPTNVAGRVRGFAWHPDKHDIVYLGSSQGGVYKSTNAGTSWFSVFGTSEVRYNIGAIALDPQNPDTLFAGTGEYRVGAGGGWGDGVGVYRTRDGGEQWDLLPGPFNLRTSRVIVDPNDGDIVYTVGGQGVMRSLNGGDTWEQIRAGACSDMALDPSESRRIIVMTDGNPTVVVTDDATGSLPLTWAAMNAGLDANPPADTGLNLGRIAASSDASGRNVLWCKLRRLSPPDANNPISVPHMRLYQWSDAARTWNQRLIDPTGEDTQGDYNNILAIHPTNANIVFHGTRGLSWTSDGGATFMNVNAGHSDQHAIAFDPKDPARVLLGNDGGVYGLTLPDIPAPGASTVGNLGATPSNAGHETVQFRNCSVSKTGALSVVGSTQDQGILRYSGASAFSFLRGTENGPMAVYAQDGKIIWWDPGGGPDYTMLLTRDGGATVRNAGSGLADPVLNQSLEAIAIHPTNPLIGLAAKGALYRTTTGAGEPEQNVITIPARVIDGATDFTCALWLRTTNRPVVGSGRAVWKNVGNYTLVSGATGVSADSFLLQRYAAQPSPPATGDIDELRLRTSLRGVAHEYVLPHAIEDDDWHHVAWVRDGNTEHLFVDGVALANADNGATSSTVAADRVSVTALVLGQRQHAVGGGFNYDEAHQDRMRDVRFYRDALTRTQIDSLVRGRASRGPAAYAQYPFEVDGKDIGPHRFDARIQGPRVIGGRGRLNQGQGVDFKAFLPVLTQTSESVKAIAFSPSAPARAYAATSTGSVYTSLDTGETWMKASGGPVGGEQIDYLTVDWSDPSRVYAGYWVDGTARRVHRSDDAGRTWTDISGDVPEVSLPNLSVTGIVVDTTSSETIYVAMPIGVFITRDGGATWAAFDEDLPNAYVSGIDLRVANNVLYASTFGRGLWQRQL